MIVVKVELHSAITGQIKLLGSMIVHNVGTSKDGKRGDYKVAVARKNCAGDHRATLLSPARSGDVKDYPRLSYNVWRLVARALLSAFPEERPKS